MVEAEGAATLIHLPMAHEMNHRIRANYVVDDAIDDLDRVWGRFDDVSIELGPVRWRSWSGSALATVTEAESGRPYEAIWRE